MAEAADTANPYGVNEKPVCFGSGLFLFLFFGNLLPLQFFRASEASRSAICSAASGCAWELARAAISLSRA